MLAFAFNQPWEISGIINRLAIQLKLKFTSTIAECLKQNKFCLHRITHQSMEKDK